MATETIGDRRKPMPPELTRRAFPTFTPMPVLDTGRRLQPYATNLYFAPDVPDRLSNLPAGRHRPEYVLANLAPGEHIRQSSINNDPNYEGWHRIDPTTSLPAMERLPQSSTKIAEPVEKPITDTSRASSPPVAALEPLKPTTQLRSATEKKIHAKSRHNRKDAARPPRGEKKDAKDPRRGRRRAIGLVAATAIVLAAFGGWAITKDRKTTPPPSPTSVSIDSSQSDNFKPPEPQVIPEEIKVNVEGQISNQDRNGWGHSANKTTRVLSKHDRTTIGTENIVAKVGAYDSLGTSPDPDAAKPGDAMITLIDPAIQRVYQLQQPLGPNASIDEQQAAKIIWKLNSLNPMATKQFVELYASDIVALKQLLSNILTSQEKSSESTQISNAFMAAPEKITSGATVKETTVFARFVDRARSAFRSDAPQTNKSIAWLAKERQNRQRQP